ncbi:magnesium/cobalt transporter CorA [Acidobacteriota bacterium]
MKIRAFSRKMEMKAGLPPGTPVYVGEERAEPVCIKVMDYDTEKFQEIETSRIDECFELSGHSTVTWINLDGIHDSEIIQEIGQKFDLHPLVLEDIVNPGQRPKMEDYGEYIYMVFNMFSFDEMSDDIQVEQISVVLGDKFVISFQERKGDIFEPIRRRIREGKGRIRKMGPDYLAYSLFDSVVDYYFIILERTGEKIEQIEEAIIEDPRAEMVHEIYKHKREVLFLRKSIWPLRESISKMEKSESPLIKKVTLKYLRDVYEHSIQIIDIVETFRDMLSGLHDSYLTSISNRMNGIMKVLTIIATIFIPLTFIAGIYGMNFDFMPETSWRWGYPAVWILFLALFFSMLVFFKKKKWF